MTIYILRHSPFLHQLCLGDYYSLYVKMKGIYRLYTALLRTPLPQSHSLQGAYYKEDSCILPFSQKIPNFVYNQTQNTTHKI